MASESAPPTGHCPVLLGEAMDALAAAAGQTFVDATVGLGGHAAEIAKRLGPSGRLVAIDQDATLLAEAKSQVTGCRVDYVHGNFANTRAILDRLGIEHVDGLLADLGLASPHVDRPERGFSFRIEGPLDMRMDQSRGETAAKLLERLSERELERIFSEYGEERYSRKMARRIIEQRGSSPIATTIQLAELVREAMPRSPRRSRRAATPIDAATRVFQAMRIAVNDELGVLEALLSDLPRCVRPRGRVAIISFHSLEDRRVKHAFRDEKQWQVLTKKPIRPAPDELAQNPRARSAKLRAATRSAS